MSHKWIQWDYSRSWWKYSTNTTSFKVGTSYYKISKEKEKFYNRPAEFKCAKKHCEVLTNLNGPVDSNGSDFSPKLNGANINLLRCNNQHSKAKKPVNDNASLNKRGYNSCNLPYQLPKLQQPATRPKKLHGTHMSLNYTIPGVVHKCFPVKVIRWVL
jgi:hypothetical protein